MLQGPFLNICNAKTKSTIDVYESNNSYSKRNALYGSHTKFLHHSSAKLCWDVVRVPLSRSLEYRHPPYHFNSPRFLTGTVRFKSTHYQSHISLYPTAKVSSTCTTAVISTRLSSIKRKTQYICHTLLETYSSETRC